MKKNLFSLKNLSNRVRAEIDKFIFHNIWLTAILFLL